MSRIIPICLILNVLRIASAFYDEPLNGGEEPSSPITLLDEEGFAKVLANFQQRTFVDFFTPSCEGYENFVPEFRKVAEHVKKAKFAAVDASLYPQFAEKLEITEFPTMMIFGGMKPKPRKFEGARTAVGIVEGHFEEMLGMQIRGVQKHKPQLMKMMDKEIEESEDIVEVVETESEVIELSDENFDNVVLESKELWMVEFFAPWCGHCKRLTPEWKTAASELKGKVNFGALDSTVHKKTSEKYDIKGYPTLKFFDNGNVEDYKGGRKSKDIIEFALSKIPSDKNSKVKSEL